MRIIAGQWKGRVIKAPKGSETRPTSDRLRETIFNILTSHFIKRGMDFSSLRILDVFAGTGALGLEALSRGAKEAVFIEKSLEACKIIQENISLLKAQSLCHLIRMDVLNIPYASEKYNLIFLDAPYHQNLNEAALENLLLKQWIDNNSLIVIESSAQDKLQLSSNWHIVDYRKLGIAGLWILECNFTS